MNNRGFASIGLVRPKDKINVGSVLRAAYCYRASNVVVENPRMNVRACTDTAKAYKHMPVIRTDNLKSVIPFDTVPVAVDLVDDAESLVDFVHPQRAFYIFGPEDGTLGQSHTSWCKHKIYIPTRFCMNLAATVNVVLYDRLAKQK